MNKPIAITMGEPAGVGGELTIKAWRVRKEENLSPFFVIDCPERLKAIDPSLPVQQIKTSKEASEVFTDALPVLPLQLKEKPVLGQLNSANAQSVIESIELAVELCLEGQASAVVTNPIHKAALYETGFNHPGHTEFIADLCAKEKGQHITPIMMLACEELRVVPLTIHIPLKDVAASISQELIVEKCRIIHQALQNDYKIKTPRIAVTGLNPHAGENGTIGKEDAEIIVPALEALKEEGIQVSGPHSADTLFHKEARAQYDIAVCMYHDQALIPIKTLDFHGGVNVTLGLPVIRTSPDHGTALDIAGTSQAHAESFINAIKHAAQVVENRA
ncbi:MAG: 4-hydroxythreonine-4-phosphate dehydrogenase PdxA [Pseudomonadota bacterium]